MVLGTSGVPWDPPDHDLETGLEKPNSSRFCAGLSPNNWWIVFSWVSFRSLSLVLGGHPHLRGAHPHLGKVTFVRRWGSFLFPPASGSLEAPVSHGGFAVPWFWGTLGLFVGGEPGTVPSCPMCCPCSQPQCSPGWLGSLCSCQICQLMRVCVSAPALPSSQTLPPCAAPWGAGLGSHVGTEMSLAASRVSVMFQPWDLICSVRKFLPVRVVRP